MEIWSRQSLSRRFKSGSCSVFGKNPVPSIVELEDVELIPVVELEPTVFAVDGRSLPSGTYQQMPEDWHRSWLESLADSKVTGLMPIQRGSWHVPANEFTDTAVLKRVLEVIFQTWLEKELEPTWGPLLGASPYAANPRMC
jgi:hypothetical protein